MKLYHHEGVWQLPGKQDRKAIKVEVPIAAPALAEFLNDRNVPAFPVFTAETVADPEPVVEITTPTPGPDPELVKIGETLRQTRWTTDAILEFILDHADVNQVANILSCLGTRVGEMAKKGA
jgi:hypothetical protein